MNRSSSLLAGVLLLLAPAAFAADRQTTERLQGISDDLDALSGNATAVQDNFTRRKGLIGVGDARRRYEDALYSYLVGDYAGAAMSFYILVQANALGQEALARDAEWYLAESLFELGNYKTALEAYQAIIDKPNQPYGPDAVRRSLEVLSLIGDYKRFDSFYEKYIVSGKVPATDLVNYTLGKSFYRRGDRARAKSLFTGITASSPWFSRAHYFLGVMMIDEKNLQQAAVEFKRVVEAPTQDEEQKTVAEEGMLALARVYYETGDFKSSTSWYDKIPAESTRHSEALYESIWTHIKQEQWEEARSEAQSYLAANPEDRHTESLQLLIGHLHIKSRTWGNALDAYDKVSETYGSVSGRLDDVARSPNEVRVFLDRLEAGQGTSGIPRFAMDMLLEDESTKRATDTWLAVGQERREIQDCDTMIAELQKALGGDSRELSSFVSARAQVDGMRGSVIRVYGRLLDAEAAWLKPRVDGAGKDELVKVLAEKDALAMQLFEANGVAGSDAKRQDAMLGYAKLRSRLLKVRSQLSDGDANSIGAQIDALWKKAEGVDGSAGDARALVDAGSSREVDAVRARLKATEDKVRELRDAINRSEVRTGDVASKVVRKGLLRLRDDIAGDVLAADKGIVDVYWIQKTESGEDMEQFAEEQSEQLQSIDDRYRRLRQNLEE